MPKKKLKDKIVLVTGGTRGIGSAIAKEFYSLGATVIITGTKSNFVHLDNFQYICTDFSDKNGLDDFVNQIRRIRANIYHI